MDAFVLLNIEHDYDDWKPVFDSDPAGRQDVAKGHIVARAVENPNDIHIRISFASVEDAEAFRDRLLESGVLDNYTVKAGPAVVRLADQATYL